MCEIFSLEIVQAGTVKGLLVLLLMLVLFVVSVVCQCCLLLMFVSVVC